MAKLAFTLASVFVFFYEKAPLTFTSNWPLSCPKIKSVRVCTIDVALEAGVASICLADAATRRAGRY